MSLLFNMLSRFSWSIWDLVPWLGSKRGPLYWECRVLATGSPGKSLNISIFSRTWSVVWQHSTGSQVEWKEHHCGPSSKRLQGGVLGWVNQVDRMRQAAEHGVIANLVKDQSWNRGPRRVSQWSTWPKKPAEQLSVGTVQWDRNGNHKGKWVW